VIILDTVRADHLGCYGYVRATSPHLDSLAATGVTFLNAQTPAPWTVPASASIYTGLSPRVHGAGVIDGQVFGLDPELPTIPILLDDAGYTTFGEFSIAWFGNEFGFHMGFDHFRCFADADSHAMQIVDDFTAWLDSLPPDRHWFAMLHFYEAHAPYTPPAPYDTAFPFDSMPMPGETGWLVDESDSILHPEQLQSLVARYDCEIMYQDEALGMIFAALRRSGRASDTFIFVTADHGEEFLEHGGYSHGHSLFDELLHVPLIIAGPRLPEGETRVEPVSVMDILPTILALTGIEAPTGIEGVDLFADRQPDRYLPASSLKRSTMFGVLRGSLKLIWNPDTGEAVTYDLASDPAEMVPLPADSALLEDLADYLARSTVGNAAIVPRDDLDRSLQGLGYIQ
jgi:arylsulfatase